MRINNLRHTLTEFRIGILSGFPPCCVLNWCLDTVLGKAKQRIKRHISGLPHGGYVPCILCYKARKQTYQRAVTELLLDTGFLDDKDYWLLPNSVKQLFNA